MRWDQPKRTWALLTLKSHRYVFGPINWLTKGQVLWLFLYLIRDIESRSKGPLNAHCMKVRVETIEDPGLVARYVSNTVIQTLGQLCLIIYILWVKHLWTPNLRFNVSHKRCFNQYAFVWVVVWFRGNVSYFPSKWMRIGLLHVTRLNRADLNQLLFWMQK